MTTLHFIGIAVGFAGMVVIRTLLDQGRKPLILSVIAVLIVTAALWPLAYFGSLGLYSLLQVARLLIAWRRGTSYDIPNWAHRLT